MSLVIDLKDLMAKHKAGELRCPATALIRVTLGVTPLLFHLRKSVLYALT